MSIRELQRPRPRAEEGHQRLLHRAEFLLDRDRTLLRLALSGRTTRRELGRLVGLPPGTVSRLLQRLAVRLYDPIVGALLDDPDGLPEEYRQVGIEYFLQGRSVRDLADRHRLGRGQIRCMIDYIRGWHRRRS